MTTHRPCAPLPVTIPDSPVKASNLPYSARWEAGIGKWGGKAEKSLPGAFTAVAETRGIGSGRVTV